MKKFHLIIIFAFISLSAAGQKGYIEIAPFHNSWAINELFKIKFSKESKFGYTNVTQFSAPYSDISDFHILMINDLSYALPKSFGITLGAVYTLENSFRPSLGLQFLHLSQKWQIMLSSKFVIWEEIELLLLSKIQYATPLTERLDLVFRSDNIHKFNKSGHSISKFRLRAGLGKKKNQVGLATDLLLRGSDLKLESSFGVFYKRAF
jgi:hypothetical protein